MRLACCSDQESVGAGVLPFKLQYKLFRGCEIDCGSLINVLSHIKWCMENVAATLRARDLRITHPLSATTSVHNVAHSAVTKASLLFNVSLLKQTQKQMHTSCFRAFFLQHTTLSGCKMCIKTRMGRRVWEKELHAVIWLWVCRCEMTNLKMLFEKGEKDEEKDFNMCMWFILDRVYRKMYILSLKHWCTSRYNPPLRHACVLVCGSVYCIYVVIVLMCICLYGLRPCQMWFQWKTNKK